MVTHYLDPTRRPPRVKSWSDRHRDEQVRYCNLYVVPIIGDLPCRRLTRDDFQQILDQAATPSVAQHLRACLSGLVNAGLEEGHLLVRQDLLRRVRWQGEIHLDDAPADRAVTEDEIPTVDAVHALAAAAVARSGVWWHELQILLVAYSGMRWGDHTALGADRVRPAERRLSIDRQIVETRNRLKPEPAQRSPTQSHHVPGSNPCRCRPGRHGGAPPRRDRAQRTPVHGAQGRLASPQQLGPLCVGPGREHVGWPRQGDGHWRWTFHSLRHVFATWALHDARIPMEDVSRLLGHSSTRVTQDIYFHIRNDMYDRFFDATG